jgi:hypothetical protein
MKCLSPLTVTQKNRPELKDSRVVHGLPQALLLHLSPLFLVPNNELFFSQK